MADFTVENHGSIAILRAWTPEAEEWIGEHVPEDAMEWCGGIVIEPRFLGLIIEGIRDDGLDV